MTEVTDGIPTIHTGNKTGISTGSVVQRGPSRKGLDTRHSPPHRGAIANAMLRTVKDSMKGQPEPLIERAILQAGREPDLLYQLVVNSNADVVENGEQRDREYAFLLGYLSAEIRLGSTWLV
jgi:hypothetical protein